MSSDKKIEPDMPERGGLIVVSAPSGAGKSSLVRRALERVDGVRFSVSYTTRPARAGEKHGEDYYFVTEEEFLRMRAGREFLESAEVHGRLYGTHLGEVEKIVSRGCDVILDIDVQGAQQIRKVWPTASMVFVLPPSRAVLETRLRSRNLNTDAEIKRRMCNAAGEVLLYDSFDYVIINDDLDRATLELQAIIASERQRPQRNRKKIESIVDTFGGSNLDA